MGLPTEGGREIVVSPALPRQESYPRLLAGNVCLSLRLHSVALAILIAESITRYKKRGAKPASNWSRSPARRPLRLCGSPQGTSGRVGAASGEAKPVSGFARCGWTRSPKTRTSWPTRSSRTTTCRVRNWSWWSISQTLVGLGRADEDEFREQLYALPLWKAAR
jgi:hypothetical protein